MRLTAPTAVAILAFAMARAGALPSPPPEATGDISSSQPPPAETVSDFYHGSEATEFEKRNPREGQGGGGGGGFPFGNWPTGGDHTKGIQGDHTWSSWGARPTATGNRGSNKRRDDALTSAPAAPTGDDDDDDQDYTGIACNCFYDLVETDAAGLPTIRCGCFRENSTPDAGNDNGGSDGNGAEGEGGEGGDAATDLSKRGKSGFFDPYTKWDWWQNQGTTDFDLTIGNPNLDVKDWKFSVWASIGGIKKKRGDDEDGSKYTLPKKARPSAPHTLSGS